MAWVAVVEVIEDNLPSPHLLILVELFLYRCLAFCDTFMRLCTRSKQSHPLVCHFLYISWENLASAKFIFPEDLMCSSSACAPIIAHDISSRCGMWEVVLIFVLFLTFLSPFWDYRQYPRCSRGVFSVPLHHLSPPPQSDSMSWAPAPLPFLLGKHGRMLSSMLSRQGLYDTRPKASGAGCYM